MVSHDVTVAAIGAVLAAGVTAVAAAIVARRGQDKQSGEKLCERLLQRIDQLNERTNHLEARTEALEQRHLNDLDTIEDLRGQLRDAQARIEALEHQLRAAHELNSEVKRAMQERVALLETRIRELELENGRLRALINCPDCPRERAVAQSQAMEVPND